MSTRGGGNPMRCRFCEHPAQYRCDWDIEKFECVDVRDLCIGDTCQNMAGNRTGKVLEIRTIDELNRGITIERTYKNPGARRERVDEYVWMVNWAVRKMTTASCWNAVCDRHVRELSESRHICAEHWRDQLAAIA